MKPVWPHTYYQPLLKSRHQLIRNPEMFACRYVACHDDLLVGFVKGVKGTDHFILKTLCVGQNMNIVHQQYIHAMVLVSELGDISGLERFDVFCEKGFPCDK